MKRPEILGPASPIHHQVHPRATAAVTTSAGRPILPGAVPIASLTDAVKVMINDPR